MKFGGTSVADRPPSSGSIGIGESRASSRRFKPEAKEIGAGRSSSWSALGGATRQAVVRWRPDAGRG
jgi:hypothetical protein